VNGGIRVARTLKFREDEKVLVHLEPHPLAFLDFYALFAYLVSIGAIFWIFEQRIKDAFPGIIPVGWTEEAVFAILFAACLIIPFLVVAILKITWRWFFLSIGISILSIVLRSYFHVSYGLQIPSIVIGVVGFALTDVYRRKFDFYITDQRVIIELSFISQKRREILYSKISDLVVERGWLGQAFNYGTVIPISESGFGLGEDVSAVTVAATGSPLPKGPKMTTAVSGGRTISVPRGRSFYVLFGVRKPKVVSEMISQQIRGYEEAPYLKKIAAGVESLVKKEEEKEKK
jgi:hypothetical protein